MSATVVDGGLDGSTDVVDGDVDDAIAGSIVGLAIGDALGYPQEFRTVAQVRREIGPEGLRAFVALKDPRFSRPMILGPEHPPGTFTDDTQMSLAVAEALIVAGHADRDTLMGAMSTRFVDWFFSDDNNRSPGAATGAACTALRDGASWRDAGVKDSKGCGANMRVAPIGLFYDDLDDVADVARDCARITHGHLRHRRRRRRRPRRGPGSTRGEPQRNARRHRPSHHGPSHGARGPLVAHSLSARGAA